MSIRERRNAILEFIACEPVTIRHVAIEFDISYEIAASDIKYLEIVNSVEIYSADENGRVFQAVNL